MFTAFDTYLMGASAFHNILFELLIFIILDELEVYFLTVNHSQLI